MSDFNYLFYLVHQFTCINKSSQQWFIQMWEAHFPSTYDTCNHDVNSLVDFTVFRGLKVSSMCVCVWVKMSNRGGNKHITVNSGAGWNKKKKEWEWLTVYCTSTVWTYNKTNTHTRWKSRTVIGESESSHWTQTQSFHLHIYQYISLCSLALLLSCLSLF